MQLLRVLLLSLPSLWSIQQPTNPQGPPPNFTPADTKLVISVPGMDKVRVLEGEVYKKVQDAELKMDVYRPEAGGPHPAVLFVSGGAETRRWGLYKDYGRITAASGLVAVMYDKRYPQGQQGVDQGGDDTVDALKHVRARAAQLGVDPDRICMWTFSAGGSLAQIGLKTEHQLRCLVAYYGLGQAGPRVQLQQSAATMPPMLVVRAGRDGAPGNNAIDTFVSLGMLLNAPLTVINYPQGLHAFEVDDFRPETKERANVAETTRILLTTIDWIKRRVSP